MADPMPDSGPGESEANAADAADGGTSNRICSPGDRTFDGCNWSTCRSDGSGWQTTLMDCEIKILLQIQFEAGSWTLSDNQRQRLHEATTALRRALEPPERKIAVVGHVLPSESRTQEALRQIATRRAEAVHKALLQEGLPKERLSTKAAPVEDGNSNPVIWRVVTFELEPNRPYATDFPRDAGAR